MVVTVFQYAAYFLSHGRWVMNKVSCVCFRNRFENIMLFKFRYYGMLQCSIITVIMLVI